MTQAAVSALAELLDLYERLFDVDDPGQIASLNAETEALVARLQAEVPGLAEAVSKIDSTERESVTLAAGRGLQFGTRRIQ